MRLGIFGGSFDPVHTGHLAAARACIDQGRADRVIFVPAAVSPFKQDRPPTQGHHRAAMLGLAIDGDPRLGLCTDELDRGGPSYTCDTLARLRALHPHDDLLLVLGPDSIASFPEWHRPDRILELADLLAVEREGIDDLSRIVDHAASLRKLLGERRADSLMQSRVRIPPITVRATDVRAAAARRASPDDLARLTTPRVAAYIRDHALYRT